MWIIGAMHAERLGRLARMLRVRQRMTQAALAARAGVTRRAVSLLECGHVAQLRLQEVEAIVAALGGRLDVRLFWNGPELDRLLDAGHAAIGASVKRLLERWGWVVRVEVSFSHFGERGRIDLVAWHPASGVLLVIEIKTDFVDVQSLLGTLDMKARLARGAVERFGWDVRSVVPVIVFLDARTIRNRLARVDSLFDRFVLRGRAAKTWLRQPSGVPTGLLWFTAGPPELPSRSSAPRVRGRRTARD